MGLLEKVLAIQDRIYQIDDGKLLSAHDSIVTAPYLNQKKKILIRIIGTSIVHHYSKI